MKVTIYDKPLCCSTGVCGPKVDPALATFADDLRWLAAQGIEVVRHNPAQSPHAFITDALIRGAMKGEGEAVLPVVAVDGVEKSRQTYPSRAELAAWTNLSLDTNDDTACCGGTGCC
jgi:hypothetical protein